MAKRNLGATDRLPRFGYDPELGNEEEAAMRKHRDIQNLDCFRGDVQAA